MQQNDERNGAVSLGDTQEYEHEAKSDGDQAGGGGSRDEGPDMDWAPYLRFGAMILTAMVFMYWVMFLGTYEWSHVRFSISRVYMTLAMGGTMGLVMLAWMSKMYRDTWLNVAVIALSVLLLGLGTFLDRSQTPVGDVAFMRAMIPHHSLAITRSERFNVDDARVCELAVEISEAQRREILEMDWLIDDIQENGAASTAAAAQERPVPDFDVDANLVCDPD